MSDMSTLTGRWWFTIDAFDERATIILNSAIARRDDLATIGTQMKFIASVLDGHTSWRMDREVPRKQKPSLLSRAPGRYSWKTIPSSTAR